MDVLRTSSDNVCIHVLCSMNKYHVDSRPTNAAHPLHVFEINDISPANDIEAMSSVLVFANGKLKLKYTSAATLNTHKCPESPNLAACQLYHGTSLLFPDFDSHLMTNQGSPQQSTRSHNFIRGTVTIQSLKHTIYSSSETLRALPLSVIFLY